MGNKKLQVEVTQVLVAAMSAIAAILVGYWQFRAAYPAHQATPTPQAVTYAGKVSDPEGNPVTGAEVSLDIGGIPQVTHTDSGGVYTFSLFQEQDQVPARVQVTADGYAFFERNVVIRKLAPPLEEIRLARLATETPPTLTLTPTPETKAAKALEIERIFPMCSARLLPQSIDPAANPSLAVEAIKNTDESYRWPFVMASSYQDAADFGLLYWLGLTNIGEGSSEPLVVSNKVKVVMNYVKPLEEGRAAEFIMGCGAGGDLRYFPQVTLKAPDAGGPQAVTVTDKDFDFFSIPPGGTEIFVIPVTCHDAGVFALHFVVSYFHNGAWVTQELLDDVPVACPEHVSLWAGVFPQGEITGLEFVGEYKLAAGRYEQVTDE